MKRWQGLEGVFNTFGELADLPGLAEPVTVLEETAFAYDVDPANGDIIEREPGGLRGARIGLRLRFRDGDATEETVTIDAATTCFISGFRPDSPFTAGPWKSAGFHETLAAAARYIWFGPVWVLSWIPARLVSFGYWVGERAAGIDRHSWHFFARVRAGLTASSREMLLCALKQASRARRR